MAIRHNHAYNIFMTEFISVTITVPSSAEAERIATALVQERLAACVSIIPAVRSMYMWEGKLHDEAETILMAKTRLEKFEEIKKLLKILHSHSCPCIVATPIVAGHQGYLDWVKTETS